MNAIIKYHLKRNPKIGGAFRSGELLTAEAAFAMTPYLNKENPKFYHYVQVIKSRHEDKITYNEENNPFSHAPKGAKTGAPKRGDSVALWSGFDEAPQHRAVG